MNYKNGHQYIITLIIYTKKAYDNGFLLIKYNFFMLPFYE